MLLMNKKIRYDKAITFEFDKHKPACQREGVLHDTYMLYTQVYKYIIIIKPREFHMRECSKRSKEETVYTLESVK